MFLFIIILYISEFDWASHTIENISKCRLNTVHKYKKKLVCTHSKILKKQINLNLKVYKEVTCLSLKQYFTKSIFIYFFSQISAIMVTTSLSTKKILTLKVWPP